MQLILNIIKNSIDAIQENSIQKNICITAYTTANKLILQIKDNGNGFDGEVAGNLFSRGFSTKLNSTGNGLYNCKTIMESHEGTIDITSEGPGKGTLATIGFKILAA
jgi:sensor histidine kinase regulating citrate/malate metabolism